jgi:hypothetical protein
MTTERKDGGPARLSEYVNECFLCDGTGVVPLLEHVSGRLVTRRLPFPCPICGERQKGGA